jgi:MFS family permease
MILTAIILNVNSIPQTTQIVLYGALRFLIGIFANVYVIGIVHVIELVGPKWRVTANNSFYYSYILGELIALTFGWFLKDYRAFHIAMAIYFTSFLFYYWLIPESPRYLLVKGKKKEALKIFKRIAKTNKVAIGDDFLDSEDFNRFNKEKTEKDKITDDGSDDNPNVKKVCGRGL